MSGKLYIIVRTYFMADFILEEIGRRPDVVIIPHCPPKGIVATMAKPLRMLLGNRRGLLAGAIFTPQFRQAISAITPADTVVLWGVENYKYIKMIAREITPRRIISFLWNPMHRLHSGRAAERYRRGMEQEGIEVCTFDPDDARLLNCREVPQVHRRAHMPNASIEPRVFFIGQEKGREQQLAAIIAALQTDPAIALDINIVKSKHHRELPADHALAPYFIDHAISYADVLEHISLCSCMIDIVQPGQTGVTLRAIESLFYGKKLITNNRAICEQPFYNPANIYVIDRALDAEALCRFVAHTDYAPVDESIINSYEIEQWLKKLVTL